MIDVKEMIRRWSAGQSIRKIAREAGRDRATVTRYIKAAMQLGMAPGHVYTDDEVHEIAQRVQSRPLRDTSAEWSEVAQHRERIAEWLSRRRPLRLTKVHTLLVREHGLQASYDTLRRFATQELDWHRKAPTVRLDDPPPGQEAQIDFGKMGLMRDAETERQRILWALIVTLSFSRYQFVWPTFSQSTEAVCDGLDRAWWFFGAMVRTLVPDNTRAMVKDPDALAPALVAAFLDYVQARGLFVDPAAVIEGLHDPVIRPLGRFRVVGKTEPLALKHMGADEKQHKALIVNRVSAANFIALTTILKPGDKVLALAPAGGSCHPSTVRPISMAGADFRQFHSVAELEKVWQAEGPPRLLLGERVGRAALVPRQPAVQPTDGQAAFRACHPLRDG